jgi:hypothetical protein
MRRNLFIILILAAWFLPTLSALAEESGSFRAPVLIGLDFRAVSVASGDFNGDGPPDLAALGGTSRVAILLGDGAGRFSPSGDMAVGQGSFFVTAADFDGDAADDLVVADPGSTAYFLRSKGDGSFDTPSPLAQALGARWAAVADWNRDGDLDLAVANYNSSSFSLFRGGGDGTLAFVENRSLAGRPHAIESIDLDGDGRSDLAVGLEAAGIQVLRGRGDGSFETLPTVTNLGCIRFMAAADLNGDGKEDLVTSCAEDGNIYAGLSQGNGSFEKTFTVESLHHESVSLAIAALDAGDAPDLALTDVGGFALQVYAGKADGTFAPPRAFGAPGTAPTFLLAADLDRDGTPDLITADSVASLTLYRGTGGADFLESPDRLGGFSSAKALAVADLDGDGAPDLFIPSSAQAKVLVYRKPGLPAPVLPPLTIDTTYSYTSLEAVDLDGDGTPDLAGASTARGLAVTALLDPQGKVRAEEGLASGLLPAAVAAGRIDGDALLDLAVVSSGTGTLGLYFGRGGGALSEARTVPTLPRPKGLALADFDDDGLTDVAVFSGTAIGVHFASAPGELGDALLVGEDAAKSYSALAAGRLQTDRLPTLVAGETTTATVYLFRGKSGREFLPPERLRTAGPPASLVLSDLDGDSLTDVTAVASANGSASLFLSGDGFASRTDYSLGLSPTGHRIADLDLDGAPDLVAFSAASAVILHGRPAGAPSNRFRRGDVNGDGLLDITDPIAELDWFFLGGQAPSCQDTADADDDGQLDLTDPIAILNRLFLGAAPLPPPGSDDCGEDPTPDGIPECVPGC